MFRQPLDLRGRRIGAKYVPQGRFQHLVAPAADALNRGSCLDVGDDANPSRRAYERQLGSRAGDARFLTYLVIEVLHNPGVGLLLGKTADDRGAVRQKIA
jgi:hypothetical protein